MKKTDAITLGLNYQIFKKAVPHHDKLQSAVAQAVADSLHNIVIDLGCGLGYTSEAVLKKCKPKSLYLVDSDKRMIDFVSQNKKILKNKKIDMKIIHKDALSFFSELKSNSIDCVYSCWVIHNLESKERAKVIKEIYRVLKKRGSFINGDKYSESNLKTHKTSFDWQELEYKKAIKKYPKNKLIYDNWINHYREDDKNRFSEKEQSNLAIKLGFSEFEFSKRFHLEAIFKAIK